MKTILVLGATGMTGRRVVERLSARGLEARVGEPPFDWAPALDSVGAVCLCFRPDLAVGVLARGARRIVLLSRRGDPGAVLGEQAVRESGADWTIVRASRLAQEFSEGALLEPVLRGELALPAREVGEPFVDAADVADVAVAALTEDGHVGRIHELTGPRLLTLAAAADELADATGREIRSVRADGKRSVRHVLDGRNARVSLGVRRVLGREARDFADFARETAATGVWDASNSPRTPSTVSE